MYMFCSSAKEAVMKIGSLPQIDEGRTFAEATKMGPCPINEIPEHLFVPVDMLEQRGWPDFTVTSLADWVSSQRPAPKQSGQDCALVLAFPGVVHPVSNPGANGD